MILCVNGSGAKQGNFLQKNRETYSDDRDLRLPRSAFRDLSEGGYQGINREATTAYWQNGLPILFSQIRPITFLSPVTVAALRGHVFVLERHILGPTWLAYDAHSGRHRARIHPRSIAGCQIVNPPRLEAGTACNGPCRIILAIVIWCGFGLVCLLRGAKADMSIKTVKE